MPCGGHSVCGFLREELLKYFSLSLVGWLLQGKANAPVWRGDCGSHFSLCRGAFMFLRGRGNICHKKCTTISSVRAGKMI